MKTDKPNTQHGVPALTEWLGDLLDSAAKIVPEKPAPKPKPDGKSS